MPETTEKPAETKSLQVARALTRAGVSVLPIKPNEKKPAISSWKLYESEIADAELLAHWFKDGNGLAYIMGKVSGNAELIDFDHVSLYALFVDACRDNGLGGLLDDLCVLQTPSGGHHLVYRTEATVCGNKKLARDAEGTTLIETRGEGGYALTFPTPGYKILHGKPTELSVLTAEQRKALHQIAGLFNDYESPASQKTEREPPSGNSPGSDYNERGDYEAVLEKHGWRRLHRHGGRQTWTRPGHEEAVLSATTGYQGARMLYVFSTNAMPFESERKYSPFAVYAMLEHGGDFAAAARALGKEGYGEQGTEHRTRRKTKAAEKSESEEPKGSDEEDPLHGKMSEFELAQRFAAKHEKAWMFVEGKQWYRYAANHWQYSNEDAMDRAVQEFIEPTGSVTLTKVRNVRGLVKSMIGPYPISAFNSRPSWIPLANGVYDTTTGELLPHDPDHRLTHIASYEYVKDADCPTWKDCLNRYLIQKDGQVCQEWIDILQEWFGYCLIADTAAQLSMFWVGGGANGKGTTTRLMLKLIGERSCTDIPIEQLHDPYHRAELYGKLIGFVDEPDPRAMQKNGNWFKKLTGQGRISARRPTEAVFEFEPTTRLIVLCNKLPSTGDTSYGYYRRIILIEWRCNISDEEKDNDLDNKLAAELPGIFNWAVEGLRRYQERRKFVIPAESLKLRNEYRLSEDDIGRYFEEELIFAKGEKSPSKDLYAHYRRWCEDAGMKPENENSLGRRLTAKHCIRERGSMPHLDKNGDTVTGQCRVWKGVRIRTTQDDEEDDEKNYE